MTIIDSKIKKICVMSDTHGSFPAWNAALSRTGGEMVLHAGDLLYHGPRNMIPNGYTPADLATAMEEYTEKGGQLFVSRGNCDADVDIMILGTAGAFVRDFQSLEWNGKRIFMMHGDNYPLFRQTALDNNVALAISGHTHLAGIVREKNTVFLNPGSTTLPKSQDGPSAALLTENEIKIISLNSGTVLKVEKW